MNKVKFGLKNVHIAPLIRSEDKITYGEVFTIPGAVNISLEPQGETADFNADNKKYFTDTVNNGYSGDLEIALIPDIMREKIFGETKDANGAYFESSDDQFKPFAIGFEIDGDQEARRFWYYNATCARPKVESKTVENSKEPSTDTLTITTMARETDNKVRVFLNPTTENKDAFDKFFDSVYEEVEIV